MKNPHPSKGDKYIIEIQVTKVIYTKKGEIKIRAIELTSGSKIILLYKQVPLMGEKE